MGDEPVIRTLESILVTGGAGFIGSNFIRFILKHSDFAGKVVNIDALTYAGNPESLSDIDRLHGGSRYFFEHADIRDKTAVELIFDRYGIDTVVNFAAESHVDRSIHRPEDFISTNILGTFTLLEVARHQWKGRNSVLFHHVSTDEVYGSLGAVGRFAESTPYDPRSPYSASKASSNHLVSSYFHTFGLPVTLSNCSNNYGPFQFPEKLIPLMILNMIGGRPLPIYGDGKNTRDWLYVEDHNAAVWAIMQGGEAGGRWNIGGENEWENLKLVNILCEKVAAATGKGLDYYKNLISFVAERPGHDRRYAIDCSKIKSELGWKQSVDFNTGLEHTISWYLANSVWLDRVRSGAYRTWIDSNYGNR